MPQIVSRFACQRRFVAGTMVTKGGGHFSRSGRRPLHSEPKGNPTMVLSAAVRDEVRRAEEALTLRKMRMVPPSRRGAWFFRHQAAMHEAGHFIVAKARGLHVTSAQINADDTGSIEYSGGTRLDHAVVNVAGDLAVRMFGSDYELDGYEPGATDARERVKYDEFTIAEAMRIARELLKERRYEWSKFVDELEQKRWIRFAPPPPPPPTYSNQHRTA